MFQLAIGVVAVSFAAVFIKQASAPAFVIAAYRMSLAFLLQAPFLIGRVRHECDRERLPDLALAAAAGLALAGHFAAWLTSLKLTSVASSTVLVTTQPIWVVAGSYLLWREKLPWSKAFSLLLAVAGAVLVGWGDFGRGLAGGSTGGALAGDALAVIGAILMAVYLMLGRRAQARLSTGAYTFVAYGVASVALTTLALLHGERLYPYPPTDWLAFAALAVVCTLVGHSLLNRSLRILPPSTVSTAILGEPVGATIWATMLLGEAPRPLQIVGGLIVLAGLTLFTLDRRGASAQPETTSKSL